MAPMISIVFLVALLAAPNLAYAASPDAYALMEKLPIRFEEGPQKDTSSKEYVARASGITLLLDRGRETLFVAGEARPVVIHLLGANESSKPEGANLMSAGTSYFVGDGTNRWRARNRPHLSWAGSKGTA
jgi:hypothetical protein